jgi:hypothetical protein
MQYWNTNGNDGATDSHVCKYKNCSRFYPCGLTLGLSEPLRFGLYIPVIIQVLPVTPVSITGISDALQQFTVDFTSSHHVTTSYFVKSKVFWVVTSCSLV